MIAMKPEYDLPEESLSPKHWSKKQNFYRRLEQDPAAEKGLENRWEKSPFSFDLLYGPKVKTNSRQKLPLLPKKEFLLMNR